MRKVCMVGLLLLAGCSSRMRPMGEQTRTALDQQLLILANKNALARLAAQLQGKVTMPANVMVSGPNSELVESLMEVSPGSFRVSKADKALKLISMVNGIDWTLDSFAGVNTNEHMALAELIVPLESESVRGMAVADARDIGMFGPVVSLLGVSETAAVFERKLPEGAKQSHGGSSNR